MISLSFLCYLCVPIWIIPLSCHFRLMFSLLHIPGRTAHWSNSRFVLSRLCLNHLSLSFLTLVSLLFSVLSLLYLEGLTLSLIPCFQPKVILLPQPCPVNAYKIQASLCVCRNGVTIVQSFDCLLWEAILRLTLPHCSSLGRVQSWGLARTVHIVCDLQALCAFL